MSPVAMHMSDGLLNAPVSVAFLVLAAVGVGFALVKARADLDDRTAPMAGLVATFIFAVQMINFPILPGASGHLLGGALAAILVGPWVGALCVTIVLVVQALLFADGGLTALGANVTNMALIGTATGFLVAVALRKIAERGKGGLFAVAFISAFVNTVVAATGFVVEYAIGGAGGVEIGKVALLMWGLHALIGIGEGLITAVTVTSVASIRPDLVYLLKGRNTAFGSKPLEVRS
ncbi:energy-coupling factor ABC transporter permease [Lentzea sp. BCCO 10_0061]|uniref:Energy-coupling factor ABC transporter permease n=1 Tax=Lentzea sokolovensis TaxID=3095429 RepID=A0ABU4UQ66_9PSEU|nr:energy-coupling factor ABC transporter permease [Lentzea sp. BCCO 10_0061]MDX8140958.1 energy-coupling factor ABC transporter permease [Lentzea sp. BCCO 10_0061]